MYNNLRGTTMVNKVSEKILAYLLKDTCMTEEKYEVMLFGITRIVEDIPKTLGILLIGTLLGVLKEMLVVTVVIALYKSFVGGVHAKTNWGCFFCSAFFYLVTIYIPKVFVFEGEAHILLLILNYVFALYCIWVYAPADVPEIPKVDEKLRRKTKVKAIVILNIIYLTSLLVVKNRSIQDLVMFSIFSINLMTTRTMYKVFKNEYGYEVYFPYCE